MQVLERTTEPLVVSDRPWEAFTLSHANVLKDGDGWHMWYGAYDLTYKYDCDSFLCYATSSDGVHWQKPSLGLVEYEGSTDNNIVFDGEAHRANVTTVFLDEHATEEERYKGLAQKFLGMSTRGIGIWHCYGMTSPDGLRWAMQPESFYPHNSDTQNVCFWDGGGYHHYMRLWRGTTDEGNEYLSTESEKGGMRTIGLSESQTFSEFPVAREILAPDELDPPGMDFYTTACTKLRDDLYVMFIACLYQEDDCVRVQAAVSRDGVAFERLGHEPLIDLGDGFDNKGVYVLPGAFPSDRPHAYWFYYMGTSSEHGENRPNKVQGGGGVGRVLIEISHEL